MLFRISILLLCPLLTLLAQQTSDNRANVRKLISMAGDLNQIEQIVSPALMETKMRDLLQPDKAPPERRPTLERFIKEFAAEFAAEVAKNKAQLIELIEAAYEKLYTPEEVKGLIEFFETPIGKKLAQNNPKAQLEIFNISSNWGQEIGRRVGTQVGARIEAEEKAKQK